MNILIIILYFPGTLRVKQSWIEHLKMNKNMIQNDLDCLEDLCRQIMEFHVNLLTIIIFTQRKTKHLQRLKNTKKV